MAAGLIPYLMSLDPAARTFTAQQAEKEATRRGAEAVRAGAGQALGVVPQLQMDDPRTRAFITSDAAKVAARGLQALGGAAATQNAVDGAAQASTDVNAGGSIGSGPGVTSAGLTPTTTTDLTSIGPDITKIQGVGGRTVYTNKGQAGYNEIRDMRDPLPSVASALRNVPDMPSVLHAQRDSLGNIVDGSATYGGVPRSAPAATRQSDAGLMFTANNTGAPVILGGGGNRFAEMDAQIDKYTRPGSSIFDQWRGRQLEKRRDKLALHESLLANSIANMTNAQTGQQRLGVDSQSALLNAMAHKYSADRTAEAHAASTKVEALKAQGPAWILAQQQKLIEAGKPAEAAALGRIFHPAAPVTPQVTAPQIPGQPHVIADPSGVRVFDAAAAQAAQAAAEVQRKREAVAGGL